MKSKRAQFGRCRLVAAVKARHHKKLSSSSQYDLPCSSPSSIPNTNPNSSPNWMNPPYTYDQQSAYSVSSFSSETSNSVCPSDLNTSLPSDINSHTKKTSHIKVSVESVKSAHKLVDTLVNAKKHTAKIYIPFVKNENDRAYVGRKILWLFVIVVCACIALIQVEDRVRYYLSNPVKISLRLAQNETLKFPLVTICNRNYDNLTYWKILKKNNRIDSRPKNDTDKVDFSYFISESDDIKKFWESADLDIEKQMTECWFGRNITCKQAGHWKKVHTYDGVCATFILNNEYVNTTGCFNNLYVRLSLPFENMNVSSREGWRFLVHNRIDVPMLDIRTHGSPLANGTNKDVRLYTRSFRTLNTTSKPCVDDPKYSVNRCTAKCFIDAVLRNSTCRLSYMDLDNSTDLLPGFCNTPESHRNAYKVAEDDLFYGQWTSAHCNCTRQCNEDIYTLHQETSLNYTSQDSRLRIYFQDFTFEEVKEKYGYSLISLLCNVGGALGFLLGVSVLTFFEIIELIFGGMVGLSLKL